jgi:RNA recognition motif-containing protein
MAAFPQIPAQVTEPEAKGPPDACLFVSGLPSDITENSLTEYFSNWGQVLKVTIMRDKIRPYGFVQLSDRNRAQEAIKSPEPHVINGKKINVEKTKVNTTLFVAKIPKTMVNADIRSLAESYGPVESVAIIKTPGTQISKGQAFIKFEFKEDAEKCLNGFKTTYPNWICEWAKSTRNTDTS